MKPSEILASLPGWADATPAKLLAHPAWTLPCRFGEEPASMRLDAIRPADTLDVLVRFENEEHVLGLSDSPAFPELHAVWASKSEMPEPVLLALMEKECGGLFQLLENAVRRQLTVVGLAHEPRAEGESLAARVSAGGSDVAVFTLTNSRMVTGALGLLRNIDVAHPSIRSMQLPGELEFAVFALSSSDAPSTGDALLLPEIDLSAASAPVRLIVAGRFVAQAETGLTGWADDGRWRVVRAERVSISFGDLADFADGTTQWAGSPALSSLGKTTPELALSLVRNGLTVASGRLVHLGEQAAMSIDATA